MADEPTEYDESRTRLIFELGLAIGELNKLGVNLKIFYKFERMTNIEIAEELEARTEQLKQRKKFLGVE